MDPLTNIYYQYYSFTAPKGTITYGTSPAPNVAHAYTGCTHSHLYNWMGTPRFTANALAGIGDSMVAYGYAMSGTTLAACAIPTIVTTTLFSTTIFNGARFQTITGTYAPAAPGTEIIEIVNFGTYIRTYGV